MKFVFILMSAFSLLYYSGSLAVESDSCACEKVECGPCMEQQGLDFYSSKCAGGKKVKSCARPQCAAISPAPAKCMAKSENKKTTETASNLEENYNDKTTQVGKKVATAQKVVGKVWVVGAGKQRLRIAKGSRLHESDSVETEQNSSVKVEFDDGNTFNLTEKSKIEITLVRSMSVEKKRQTILNLIKGKVRSRVLQKYKGAGSFYRVKTRSAVAGVRGTDFVVSFMQGRKEVTTVQTIKGSVQLMDKGFKKKRMVMAHTKASFIIAANSSETFEDSEIEDFIAKGYMTPVYKMSAAEINDLDWSTQVLDQATRAVASAENKKSSLCHAPAADINQCSWTCENNPVGSSKCRVEMPDVRCVRRRCNANGKWAEESRVPASNASHCQGEREPVVQGCDY